jgi:hypothetical protein
MTTTASCGHILNDDEESVVCALARYDRQDDRCIHYVAYCLACYEQELANGDVLLTELDEKSWLEID